MATSLRTLVSSIADNAGVAHRSFARSFSDKQQTLSQRGVGLVDDLVC